MTDLHDIVIVGAGVSGLTLALACNRSGLSVVVLERDKSRNYRRQGYFLMLSDECVDAVVESCGLDPEGARPAYIIDFDMACKMPIMNEIPQSSSQFGVRSGGAVRRGQFRDRMLDACALRGVDVRFDVEVVDIVERADGKCAAVTQSGEQMVGCCLAGCDGTNSRIRRWLSPDARTECCGAVCVRGFAVDNGVIRELAGQEPGSRAPSLGGVSTPPGLGMNMTLVGGKVTWVVELTTPVPEALVSDVPSARRAVEEATRGFHPTLRKLLLEDTADEAIYVEALKDLGCWAGPFGRGAVTILGDAAHPSVWFGGGNRGIIDAVEMARTLQGTPMRDNLPARLRATEAAMQVRAPADESASKMRARLPSALGNKLEERFRKSEAERLARWKALQSSPRASL